MFNVTIKAIDIATSAATETTTEYGTERAARNAMAREVKWEGTVSVHCPELNFEEVGDFAGLSHPCA